jgi:hypothetical protein
LYSTVYHTAHNTDTVTYLPSLSLCRSPLLPKPKLRCSQSSALTSVTPPLRSIACTPSPAQHRMSLLSLAFTQCHMSFPLQVTFSPKPQATPQQTLMLAAPQPLHSIFAIYSVAPPLGSIGGGTLLTIKGAGFDAENPSSNVVVLPVPVSTSYPNGAVLCDVTEASYSVIRCR